jgi:cytoskeletal protein CcmA (bactofilin family)
MRFRAAAVIALAIAVLAIPNAAFAQSDVNCTGYISGTFHNVTAFAGCEMDGGTHITGNVTVQQGGTLLDYGARIDGNVQAQNALWINIEGISGDGPGQIGGDLQITGTTSSPGVGENNTLCHTNVGGNVQVHNNSAASPFVIGGPVQNNLNYACLRGALVIQGDLQVHNNAGTIYMEASGTGVGNTAGGNIEVHNNTGGGFLQYNSAGQNCMLHNNKPAFYADGSNTAGKTNDCTRPD